MTYRVYNGTQLLGDVNNKSAGINGLLPATSYQFSVSNHDGNRESPKTTITVKTRGIRLIIPTSLTVNSTITLNYQEYSLGLVPIGTEPAGMFGGGNKRNIQAKVISVDNGKSTVELLEPLESSSTVSVGGTNLLFKTKDMDDNNKNWYRKGSNTYYDKKYDKKAIHSWGNYSSYVSNQTIHLEANTDYAVSTYLLSYQSGNSGSNGSGIEFRAYAKNTADNQVLIVGVLQNTKGNLSNTEWRRFSAVYHNTTAKDITDFRIEAFGDWSTVSSNVWIAEIKLEKGTIATDYTQAPEDTQYIVDNTQMNRLQDGSFAAFNGYRAIYFRQ